MNERLEALKRVRSEAGKHPTPDPKPTQLTLEEIAVLPELFQPRYEVSDYHVRALKSAVSANRGEPLDAVLVWWSGERWYLLDGHHRLDAYERHNAEHPDRPIRKTNVKTFCGTLAEAMMCAAGANSKDKLPMSQQDKSNAAWRLVCMEDEKLKKSQIARKRCSTPTFRPFVSHEIAH